MLPACSIQPDGNVLVINGPISANAVYFGGMAVDPVSGGVYVTTSIANTGFAHGILITNTGAIFVAYDEPVDRYAMGFAFKDSGALILDSSETPIDITDSFVGRVRMGHGTGIYSVWYTTPGGVTADISTGVFSRMFFPVDASGPISITNGTYSLDGAPHTAAAGNFVAGNSLILYGMSPDEYSTHETPSTEEVVVNVNGTLYTFTITAIIEDYNDIIFPYRLPFILGEYNDSELPYRLPFILDGVEDVSSLPYTLPFTL